MSTHRYKRIGATSIRRIQDTVDPAATSGACGTVTELDVVLVNDAERPVLDELMDSLGFAFVATSPPAADVVKSNVLVTDFTGLSLAPPLSAPGHARMYFDSTTGTLLISRNGGPYQSADNAPAPYTQIIPQPVIVTDSQQSRSLTGSGGGPMEGGAYRIERRATVSTFHGRIASAGASGGIIKVALYQVPGGLPVGVANLIASGSFTTTGSGSTSFTISLGPITIEAGTLYLLNGLASGILPSVSTAVYENPSIDLLTTNGVAGLAPIAYTTSFQATAAPPATFNPVSQGTLTSQNTVPVIRFS
jgi:hypothetical protein